MGAATLLVRSSETAQSPQMDALGFVDRPPYLAEHVAVNLLDVGELLHYPVNHLATGHLIDLPDVTRGVLAGGRFQRNGPEGRYRPFARFPLPTWPSSPCSALRPVTVR